MACLNYSSGNFYNSDPSLYWRYGTTSETLSDGTSISMSISGSSGSITISNSSTSTSFSRPLGGEIYFMAFGNPVNYLLVMEVDSSGSTTVIHVNTSDGSLDRNSIGSVLRSSSIPLPTVMFSPTTGDMFLIIFTNGTSYFNVAIRRSDNGDSLVWAGSYTPTLQTFGDITSTQLVIEDSSGVLAAAPLPEGESDVSPSSHTFPSVVIGSGVDPSLSSHEEEFTIENSGTDCLTISSITDGSNFQVSGTSRSLPVTLDVGESMTVDVEFTASSVGSYSESLPISMSPSNGDTNLVCQGNARSANLSLNYSSSVNFGAVPVSSTDTRNVTITNNGEADATLNIPASSGSNFTWSAYSGTLSPGDSHTLSIQFNPSAETTYSQTLSFTSSAYSGTRTISLSGEGCVANASMTIDVPTGPYIDLGEVQEGFRSVAIVRVENTGDGTLDFDVRIDGTDASLFGIQEDGGSITSPDSSKTFSVDPVTACGSGSTGSGEVVFGVTFYANDSTGTYQAELVFENHNDSSLSSTITHDLQAEIIEAVKVDAELVMDRSGSMSDPSGGEIKSDVSINAGQLFVELLRPNVEDRIGLVRFNETPEVVSSIQEITSSNQSTIAADINSTNFNPTGNTCIAGGVRVAEKDMDDNPRSTTPDALNSVIVVLTDGIDNTPYTDPDDGVTYTLLGGDGSTALPAPSGKKLYAVGIGDSIDTARLSVLANETSGDYLHVTDFSGTDLFSLEKYYTQIFMDSVDLAVISDPVYYIDPNQQHVIPFDILQGDTGLMIVIYDKDSIRVPFHLVSPSGTIIDITSIPAGFQLRSGITSTARFIELKFPPGEVTRYAGVWKVIIEHNGKACVHSGITAHKSDKHPGHQTDDFGFGFTPTNNCDQYDRPIMYGIAIGAGSNFRMTPFVEPGIVKLGDPIKLNALISEFGQPVTGCNVTVEVETPSGTVYNYTMLDDGLHEDDDADDGNYGKRFTQTNEEGTYNFTFRSSGRSRDGEPVKREAVRSKYVEGSTSLVPNNPTYVPDTTDDDDKDDCCKKITLLLYGIMVILIALLFVTWWR